MVPNVSGLGAVHRPAPVEEAEGNRHVDRQPGRQSRKKGKGDASPLFWKTKTDNQPKEALAGEESDGGGKKVRSMWG